MRKFGLIGYPLDHSFSKAYFKGKFEKEGISDASYELYPIKGIEQLQALFNEEPALAGLNVTIPYKEEVIPHLDELDELSRQIGAVNTIKAIRESGDLLLKGYNTDVIGFKDSLSPHLGSLHQSALIFGTGGASKAIAYALKELGIDYTFVSRSASEPGVLGYDELSSTLMKSHLLLINCTPLGTYPHVETSLPIDYNQIGAGHLIYDLVYNPAETLFLKRAKEKEARTMNGLAMLKLQAEASWSIWNDK